MTDRRLCVVYPSGRANDSIAEHGQRLAAAFAARTGAPARHRDAFELDDAAEDEVLLLQYNPFSWGARGFAPELLRQVARVRRQRVRPRILLTIHEPFTPLRANRTLPMAVWQRAQLGILLRMSDAVVVVCARWAQHVPHRSRWFHLPVGSNLPDASSLRARSRAALGVGENEPVIAAFGTDHPSRVQDHIAKTIAVVDRGVFLNLGRDAPDSEAETQMRVVRPGEMEGQALAELIAAADVFLSPCIDGVTTRRTSLVAALQHGVPVVGTETSQTDEVLRHPALLLSPVEDVPAFAGNARAVLADDARRRELATAARELYLEQFDWPVLARRLERIIEAV